ncbi:type II toxin-antitoxin system SpoIISA family toxin [Planococcus sp. 1R117A]|uniref:type II toxin-antitoxin system SpoIISA family toxin n=1 Tax=Planococcus sp. 1R117A TaxID=3447020 RepID=UPI003EDBE489
MSVKDFFSVLWNFLSNPIVLVVMMALFLMVTFVIFLFKTETYYNNLLSFRKGFYLFFVSLLCILLIDQTIAVSDWQLLLQLAGAAIFLDLALFQTPDITKIWNAEFKQGEYTLKTLSENKRILRNNTTKVLAFHNVVAYTDNHLVSINPPENWAEYQERLRTYFSEYTDKMQLQVHLREVDTTTDDDELKRSMNQSLTDIIRYHGMQSVDVEQQEQWITRLDDGHEVEITSDLGETIVVMPYFGYHYNFLLSVVGKGEIKANGVDASHLMNMAYILDWWLP